MEAGDDCCGVTCFFRDEKSGLWVTGSVKYSRLWRERPNISMSPLYRLESFHGTLEKEETVLSAVQQYVGGEAEKGQRLWETASKKDNGFTDNEILALLKE